MGETVGFVYKKLFFCMNRKKASPGNRLITSS